MVVFLLVAIIWSALLSTAFNKTITVYLSPTRPTIDAYFADPDRCLQLSELSEWHQWDNADQSYSDRAYWTDLCMLLFHMICLHMCTCALACRAHQGTSLTGRQSITGPHRAIQPCTYSRGQFRDTKSPNWHVFGWWKEYVYICIYISHLQ